MKLGSLQKITSFEGGFSFVRGLSFGSKVVFGQMKKIYFLFLLIGVFSCSKDDPVIQPDVSPIDLSQSWQVSNEASEGIDDLSGIVSGANQLKRLTSLLVLRNGKLIVEEYYKGFKKDSLHDGLLLF